MSVSSSPPPDVLVLTSDGRQHLQERRDRTLEALELLAERMKAGQAADEELVDRRRLLAQLDQVNRVLARAAEVAAVDEDPTIVEVGDEIVVEADDSSHDTYALVHPAEASAAGGRISTASPLGRALLGARPGDRVVVHAPVGAYTVTVRARRRLT